jgi:hypothetical protein
MSDINEYVVTLKKGQDCDCFYDDMETPGGTDCIPDRAVECANRRPISRNTHYWLTAAEAEALQNDPRVAAVTMGDIGRYGVEPVWEQTGTFSKTSTDNTNDLNWGVLRCVDGVQIPGWGTDGTPDQTGTAQYNAAGLNVDVVIIDGFMDPTHPEFAVNSDGTGGTRVNQFNWFSLNSYLGRPAQSPYVYTPVVDPGNAQRTTDNNHGCNVAGIACGSNYGWARGSNIYNINPYGTDPNNMDFFLLWDYVRAFHATKPINPAINQRNPTICNCSYGQFVRWPNTATVPAFGPVTLARWGGVTSINSSGLSNDTLLDRSIYAVGGVATTNYYNPAIEADVQDALDDGIVVVGAAGNLNTVILLPTDPNYDGLVGNRINATYGGTNYYWDISKGTTPGSVPGVICVGSVGTASQEYKSSFSNNGPGIDVFAPGSDIMSSVNSPGSFGGIPDPVNPSYWITKLSGTSMSSPQVCGILACLMQSNLNLTATQAKQWIDYYSTKSQMTDTGGEQRDPTALRGAPNQYLFAKKLRPDDGNTFPVSNFFIRPTSGAVWPRPQIRR